MSFPQKIPEEPVLLALVGAALVPAVEASVASRNGGNQSGPAAFRIRLVLLGRLCFSFPPYASQMLQFEG